MIEISNSLRLRKIRLNGNTLKIIAAISMLIDHIGVIYFPDVYTLRIIGRIAFPVFAFMISEGCIHTHNRKRYLLDIAAVGMLCQIVSIIAANETYLNVMLTFSLSVLLIYAYDYAITGGAAKISHRYLPIAAMLVLTALLELSLGISYGFVGALLPLSAYIFRDGKFKIVSFTLCLSLLCIFSDSLIQYFSLIDLPLIAIYSGKRGKLKMKYFFYVFYPVHLGLLWGIYYLTL